MTDRRLDKEKKRVSREDVAEYIANEIIESKLNPGDRIVETRLSKELQVSQGAVREAIRDLIAKGMLVSKPYKGTYVRAMSLDDIIDYFRTREVLEQVAMDWALDSEEGRSCEMLKLFAQEMILQCSSGGKQFSRIDYQFHKQLIGMSGNSSLVKAWETLGHLLWIAISLSCTEKKHLADMADIHTKLACYIESGNRSEARKVLKKHFTAAVESAREWFAQKEECTEKE